MIAQPVAFQWIEAKTSAKAGVGYKILACVAFALATAIGAQIRINLGFTPVPITLQTLFVFSSGLFLGPWFGLLSQALYVSMGAAGLPVYSDGGHGVEKLFGATGGYLLGFMLYSYLSGQLFYGRLQKSKLFVLQAFQLYLLSVVAVFVPGVVVLKIVLGVDWAQALLMGYVPFVLGDIVKISIGLAATRRVLKRL
ncbi:MAG: biotin transporter BioY [Bdellovibrionia bacterium]